MVSDFSYFSSFGGGADGDGGMVVVEIVVQ